MVTRSPTNDSAALPALAPALAPAPAPAPAPAKAKATAKLTTSETSFVLRTTTNASSSHKRRKRSTKLYAIQRDRSYEFNLRLDINDLQQEIQSLTMHKQLLASRILGASTLHPDSLPSKVIREFHRLFRFGYREFDDQIQRDFLVHTFHHQVDCGQGVIGIDTLCRQFRAVDITIPKLFVDMNLFKFEFVRAERDLIVTTWGKFEGVLTRFTLESIFPHVLADEHLVQKVLGKVITCPVKWRFVFNENGKVTCFGADIDYVGPFTKLLRDLGQVTLVLGENMDWRAMPDPKPCENVNGIQEVCWDSTNGTSNVDEVNDARAA